MNSHQISAIAPENWRDVAMNESLQGFGYGENLDALLAAIRRMQPHLATQIAWPDREQTVNFLKQFGPLQSLLSAPCDSVYDDTASPYLAWYRVQWQGNEIEVALSAGHSNHETICLGEDAEILRAFVDALLAFALRPSGRCLRYSEGWENAPDLDKQIGNVTWDDIVLPPEILGRLRETIEGFFAHREIVRDFGFAWRRGVLLVGPPGTGKTMVCKAAAAALPDLPFLYVRDLRENKQKDSIQAIFARARKLSPCLLAFEDIDGFVNPQNRTVFLNEMDGFTDNDGLLVIASSNHPGKIDEALLKRPSRFDRVFHLGLPAHGERRAFCEHILGRSSLSQRLSPDFEREELAEQVAAKTDGFTPAYLKEIFVSAALQCAQNGEKVLDASFAAAVLMQVEELKSHLKRLKNPEALGEMRALDDAIGFRR